MSRRLASGTDEAGKLPSTPPVSVPASRLIDQRAAAASCGRRRPVLSSAFWPSSASGFMLQPHEALVPGRPRRFAVCSVLCNGRDLHARGEGRHEDVFRPALARRTAGRPAASPDLLGAERECVVAQDEPGEYAGPGFGLSLQQLFGHAGERQHVDESGIGVDQGEHESAVAKQRFHLDDGRWSAGERRRLPCHGARGSGNACRRGHGDVSGGRGPLFGDLVVPRSATRPEFARAPDPATAADAPTTRLTTPCVAGGQHGG